MDSILKKVFKTASHELLGEFRLPPWERREQAMQQLPQQRHYAAITREVLNADGMSLTVFVGGQSNVGISLSGTWVGTASFYGSALNDPLNFFPIPMTPFASGTNVNSATANGNFFTAAKNYAAVRVVFTRTSGSVQVSVAPAQDSSWQDAFLAAGTIANSSAAASGVNTLTQAAQANRAWNLTSCIVSFASQGQAGGAGRLTIYDGTVAGTILYEEYIQQPTVAGSVGWNQVIDLPRNANGQQSVVNTPGNAMTIVLRGMSGSSIINTNFSAA